MASIKTLHTAAIAAALLVTSSFAQTASAQQDAVPTAEPVQSEGIQCSAFQRNTDGSWNALQPVEVVRQNEKTTIAPNMAIRVGMPKIAGLDLALTLDAACGH